MSQYEKMTTEPIRKLTMRLAVPSILSMVIANVYSMSHGDGSLDSSA